jgi:WD40 repeat protein
MKLKNSYSGHSSPITSLSIYRQNNTNCVLSSADAQGKIKLWDLKSKNPAVNYKGHFASINCVKFSPDLTCLASGDEDGYVKIWDLRNGKIMKEINNFNKSIISLEFNPEEIGLLFSCKDKIVRYYNLKNYEIVTETNPDKIQIENIIFDKKNFVFLCTNDNLKYYEMTAHKMLLHNTFETGWKKLQSVIYVKDKYISGLSVLNYTISYFYLRCFDLFKGKKNNESFMSNIDEEDDENIIDDDDNFGVKENNFLVVNSNKKKHKNKNRANSVKSKINNKNDKNKDFVYSNKILKDILNDDDDSDELKNDNKNDKNDFSLGISKFINSNMTDATVNEKKDESIFIKNAKNILGIQNNNYTKNLENFIKKNNKNNNNKNNNKNNKNNNNKNNQTGKFGVQNDNKINDKKIKLKTKEIKQNIKPPSNQGNVVNMGQIDNLNPQIKMINVNQNEISNNQNYNFNSGTFNPNKQNYTQNIPQQMNNNTIINDIPQYINNNVINNNIPQQMNNNIINHNIPQQMTNNIINNNQIYQNNNVIYPQMQFPNQNQFNQIPSYPYQSPYIQGQIPYNLNQQIPQYNMQNINYNTTNNNVIYQMPEGQIIDNTNSKVKRHINYKPKSLKEYKEKYINDKDINKQRGGLGPNIGTKEWDEREKVKNKVKEYSQKIKGINEEHNIKNNMKYKKDDIIKNQLYDSFNENADIEEEKKLTDEEITVNQNLENETNNDNYNKIEVKDIKNESRMNFLRKLAQKNEEKRNQNNKKKKKEEEESEKKLGKVYTTLKPTSKQKNRQNQQYQTPFDIKKIKDNEINEREKKKNKKINYEDDITKQFMQNIPNEYNGLVKDNKGNLVINPTGEIEHLLQTNKVFNAKVNQIKDYINHMK